MSTPRHAQFDTPPPAHPQAHCALLNADLVPTIAGWLANQPHTQVPLAALSRALPEGDERVLVAVDVRPVVRRLHILGFVRAHHGLPPRVSVLHREGLTRLAAGEALAAVAADVERSRPLTVIRTADGQYAAWYLPVLLLPAGAGLGQPDWAAAVAATADEAVAVLRQQAQAACDLEPAIGE